MSHNLMEGLDAVATLAGPNTQVFVVLLEVTAFAWDLAGQMVSLARMDDVEAIDLARRMAGSAAVATGRDAGYGVGGNLCAVVAEAGSVVTVRALEIESHLGVVVRALLMTRTTGVRQRHSDVTRSQRNLVTARATARHRLGGRMMSITH